jgi:lipopolysaccharide export system protein LptA
MTIDLERLLDAMPPDAVFLSADLLNVLSHPDGPKPSQEMTAEGRVEVEAREFGGRAQRVYYDSAKDQIIFDGGDQGEATLYKHKVPGTPPSVIKGKKIIYNRRTGEFSGDGIREIKGT